ncbi:MAG: ABC transporter substrate-binding protein [Actinobacteria bacterium]|nr:ABC transporter substrate-binding protein [Actinomycetota bacterium]
MIPGALGKARILSLAAAALIAVLVAGCGGGGSSSGGGEAGGSTGSGSSAAPNEGGKLTVALAEEVNTLEPQQTILPTELWVISQVSEPLWRENTEGELAPWLLKGVKTSNNERVWTLTLKSGIKFSNGQPMTSADVLFTLERARKSEYWEELLEGITKVEAPSPSTIVITNAQPAAELPALLSQWSFGIEPKNLAGESEEEFASKPIGTGPFEIAAWKRGETLTMKKNPNYWIPKRPYLDELVFKTVPDPNSRVSQLNSGEVNVIATPPWSQVEAIEASPETELGTYPLGFNKLMTLNGREALFKNPKVREAINLGIDREGMVNAVLHGHGEAAASFVPPPVEFHDSSIKTPEFNPGKAKELLAEAVKEGVNPTFTVLTPIEDDFWPEAVQILQQNLDEVGFNVKIQKVDVSTWFEDASAGKFGAGPLQIYTPLTTQTEIWAFYNTAEGQFAGISTKETEKVFSEALRTPSSAKRKQLYHRLQEIVAKEQYIISVAYTPFSWAFSSNVTGLYVGRVGIPWFAEAGLSG